jgi:alcohol dehydrogenase class IV
MKALLMPFAERLYLYSTHSIVMDSTAFEYEFAPGPIHFGRGVARDIGKLLDTKHERVIVVTGRNVGQNPVVREPIVETLDNRDVRWFNETTPENSIETAFRGV